MPSMAKTDAKNEDEDPLNFPIDNIFSAGRQPKKTTENISIFYIHQWKKSLRHFGEKMCLVLIQAKQQVAF